MPSISPSVSPGQESPFFRLQYNYQKTTVDLLVVRYQKNIKGKRRIFRKPRTVQLVLSTSSYVNLLDVIGTTLQQVLQGPRMYNVNICSRNASRQCIRHRRSVIYGWSRPVGRKYTLITSMMKLMEVPTDLSSTASPSVSAFTGSVPTCCTSPPIFSPFSHPDHPTIAAVSMCQTLEIATTTCYIHMAAAQGPWATAQHPISRLFMCMYIPKYS